MKKWVVAIFVVISSSCENSKSYLEQVLISAGKNRPELEKVIAYYSSEKTDSLKLKAALFLIENMPGHYSYRGNGILQYYEEVDQVLASGLPLDAKKDSVEIIAAKYPELNNNTIPDIEVITADYLIRNIEHAFECWEKPWAVHLNFNQFCEFILPYKCFELQQLDYWKDTLSVKFKDQLHALPFNDESYNTEKKIIKLIIKSVTEDE